MRRSFTSSVHDNKNLLMHKQINTDLQNATTLNPTLFRRLLLLAIFCFSTIWAVDSNSAMIATFDAHAYPLCIAAFVFVYFLSLLSKMSQERLFLFTYFIVASYLLSSSIWHHAGEGGLYSNAAQWLGLNYVIAYLFLEVRRAVTITIIVFVFTVLGHYLALIQHHNVSDSISVVMNIAIAQFAYIVLLWTVVKLRTKALQVVEKVNSLEDLAYIDLVTRILNRRGIENIFQKLKLDDNHDERNYAILLIDIDHFKQVNDQHGHLVGDAVLTNVAAKLRRVIHNTDVIGRWGGEEFLVLTLDRTTEQTLALAEKIRAEIESFEVPPCSGVTVSIGIAFSSQASSTTGVFTVADKNLYVAKNSGRNNVLHSFPTLKKSSASDKPSAL